MKIRTAERELSITTIISTGSSFNKMVEVKMAILVAKLRAALVLDIADFVIKLV